ncbi:HD domain-containing protein [Desulfoluna spongiiphila]|uniref:HD domain-containing protein n=1 Tax=Desulfoluna spongiiphila TaxID=419481 RepID=UPI001255B748|nr:HD domain-containing protein [Desulfoluna spongiiphila]VVS92270.1 hd domain [Desulfoluna spongiiphila]
MSLDVDAILKAHYGNGPEALDVLLAHSRCVAEKALSVAHRVAHLEPDLGFIAEAAMLHDIGMIHTWAPGIGCRGEAPYIRHGVIGAEMLLKEGLPGHARVCERHTGAGLTAEEIIDADLPLPHRDLQPETLEEKIICYADKFFSKNPDTLTVEKPMDKVRRLMARYGDNQLKRFDAMASLFD